MFEHQKRVEIERRALKAGDDRARAGLPPADPDTLRLIVADELERELERKRLARPQPRQGAKPRVSQHPVRSAKPVARPLAPVKPSVPPHLAAERARALAIIEATPVGAESDRDTAISNGTAIDDYNKIIDSHLMLRALRAALGR